MNIFNEDCKDTLLYRINDDSLDLTITSPPYNVDLKYDEYNDNIPYKEYLQWLADIFKLVYQKTKIGGRCVINIGDQQNGRVSLHSDIIKIMTDIGWLNFSIIIWNKNTCNSRTAWGSFLSPSNPSFPRPFEYLLIFSKIQYKLNYNGMSDLLKSEFVDWSYGLWTIKPQTKQKIHPAQFPEELVWRCVKMLSWVDALIYDPFSGSGTVGVVCKKLNRKFIGSELSEKYTNLGNTRIKNTPIIKNKNLF